MSDEQGEKVQLLSAAWDEVTSSHERNKPKSESPQMKGSNVLFLGRQHRWHSSFRPPASSSTTKTRMQQPSEKSNCAVCLEDLRSDLVALRCGHVFHQPCAARALATCVKCPICRTKTLAKKYMRLFYSAGDEAPVSSCPGTTAPPPSPVPATPAPAARGAEPESPVQAELSTRFSELQLSLSRLTVNQRRISSHSFRLQTENVRLRQENERAIEQLEAARIKQEELVKELGVWKRICE